MCEHELSRGTAARREGGGQTERLAHFTERFQSGVRLFSGSLQGIEKGGNSLVDRTGANDLLSDVERLRGRRTNVRIAVDEGGSNGRDDSTLVSFERRL